MGESIHGGETGNPLPKVASTLAAEPAAREKFKDAGIVPLVNGIITIPYESFCGARGMVTFMMDLYKHQDLVREAMKVAAPEMLEANRQILRRIKPLGIWVGGWRTASEMLAPTMWKEFVWPYYKATVEMAIEEGVIPILHLDSDWTRDLDFFKELPKHKCIFSPDGVTDIRKARQVLDNHMAILGDVPAELLAFGSTAEVKEYVNTLIKELGAGYMVGSGCDIPFNAKRENIEAMIEAVHEA